MLILFILIIALIVFLFVKRWQLRVLLAKLRFMRGDTDGAAKGFAWVNCDDKLSAKDLIYYGYILMRKGDFGEAEDVLGKAEYNSKTSAERYRAEAMLALVEWKNGDLEGAIEILEEIIEDFKQTAIYQNLGLFYVLEGDGEKALSFNKEALDYNSDDLIIRDNLAQSYLLCGDSVSAEEIYSEMMKKNPSFPEAYYGYGFLLIDKGEVQKGEELVRKSLDMNYSYLSVLQKSEVEELLNEKLK